MSTGAIKIEAFNYGDVQLLDSMFKARFDVNRNYLLSLDNDSLLYPYRFEAALPHWEYHGPESLTRPGKPYGGWEHPTCSLRGHFLGHFLSACARIYATTGDKEIKNKADSIVMELARCQQQNGNGYVGPIPEKFFDILESGKMGQIWAPYYVIHKVLMGLYEMYKFAGNRLAFQIMKGMVDYIKRRVEKIPDEWMQKILNVEFGGMPEVLYDFYAEVGDPQYLSLAQKFEHKRILDPLAKNQDILTRVHGNTTIPKIHGAARAYEITGIQKYRDIAINFWEIVARTRTYATGGSTVGEVWGEPHKLKDTLSEWNQETCVTYNWMRLCRYLLRWTGDAKYGDMYERALFNGILAAQNPADGMFIYFLPLKTGSKKRFGTPTDSFWCCYGTGVQAFADLASSIYFYDDDSIYVNLFIPSEVRWSHSGAIVRVRQENNYPEESATRLTIQLSEEPVYFGLRIRVPWWIKKGIDVKLNGEHIEVKAAPSTFVELKKEWRNRDVVDVVMPMSLYAEPINDDENLVAIMYGPLVMAGLTSEEVVFKGDKNNLESWIEPIPGEPLAFKTKGQEKDVKFIPLYKVISEEYGVYFRIPP